MTAEYFFTLPFTQNWAAFEYQQGNDFNCDCILPVQPETNLAVPAEHLATYQKLVELGYREYPTGPHTALEFDLDAVADATLPTPGVFVMLGSPEYTQEILTAAGITDTLPELAVGLRYTHLGLFLGRATEGCRLIVSGLTQAQRDFVLAHGGDDQWFDLIKNTPAGTTVSFDFVNGQVHNLRLEIHPAKDAVIPGLTDLAWTQDVIANFDSRVAEHYADNMPLMTSILNFKVGANTADINADYLKLYMQAYWRDQ